jgi:hypothetical protein
MQEDQRKRWLYVAAIAFAALTVIAAFWRPSGAWPLTVLAIACVLAANIDKIDDLRASGAGFNFQWTRRAEAAVHEMSEIAGRLGDIETSTQKLLIELEAKTEDLVGHITGGESYPLVRVVPAEDGTLALIVECKGKYSLRGLSVRLVDASVADPRSAPGTSANVSFIAARTLKQFPGHFFDHVRQSDKGRLDIFFDAFNGVMYQFLDYRKVDGQWHFASCVLAHGRAFKHMDDPDFGPQPDWDAERVRLRIDLEHEPSGRIL